MKSVSGLSAAVATAVLLTVATAASGLANVALTRVSVDPYTNSTSQHRTEVEPDTHSHGTTEVAAFQLGRFNDGGSSNTGFAVTTDGGSTWTHGVLPGTTVYANGPWARLSDPAVAYDPKHGVWLISSLALNSNVSGAGVIVNRSTNGGTRWTKPVTITDPGNGLDKDWIGCDETATSPYYGNCYAEWDDNGNHNLVYMSTSTDGGLFWAAPLTTAGNFHGIGGQPVVQPDGTVVVPIDNANQTSVDAFTSTDGGASWSAPVVIAAVQDRSVGGSFRHGSLPSAVVDSSGTVYVAWESCSLEASCSTNDVLLSTSTSGTSWTAPVIVPIDPRGSATVHMLPGIGVDPATAGSGAHLGIDYDTESTTCTSNCTISVGFISSSNGGATWSAPVQLAGPINQAWLADTNQGRMVGDYNSTSFLGGLAFPVFAAATAPSGPTYHEQMDTAAGGLAVSGGGAVPGRGSSLAAGPDGAADTTAR